MSLKYVGETALQENIVKTKEHVESVRATLDAAKQDKIELATMPQASEDNLGLVVIYTGSTTSTYTHGYMYECVSDGETPATYSWEQLTSDVKIDNTTIVKDAYTGELSAALATTHSLGIVKGGTGTMIGDYGEVNVYQRLQEGYVGDPGSRVSVPYYDSKFRLNIEDNGNYKKGGIYELQINAVTPVGTENPSEEGWYEYAGTYGDDSEYELTEDTTVDSEKTYYTIAWEIVSANSQEFNTDDFEIENNVVSLDVTQRSFTGTQAEWDALTTTEKAKYTLVNIIDSYDKENILYADMPIGTIVPFGGSSAPTMFLLCDGSEVAKATYPELYEVIGDVFGTASDATMFCLPDLRECVPVGVGKNITKSIASHDRFNLGQFKDDQFQGHQHYDNKAGSMDASSTSAQQIKNVNPFGRSVEISSDMASTYVSDTVNGTPRVGNVTRGKRVGVNYIIKAKESGMPTDVTEGVRDVVAEMEGYSTAETDTGKTWIDGKRIYRRVFNVNNINTTQTAAWVTILQDACIEDIDIIVSCTIIGTFGSSTNGKQRTLSLDTGIKDDILKVYTGYTMSVLNNTCVLEYTKTT